MNLKTRVMIPAIATLAALAPAMAMAHPGHGVGQDFVAGLVHPLTGLDHVLMIVALGAWAALMPRANCWVVAGCLALFVACGALLPVAQVSAFEIEAAIAFTLVGAGILLAFDRCAPLWAGAVLPAAFGLIHGVAHAVEGPANSLMYIPGLALTTGGLAFGASLLAERLPLRRSWWRVVGAGGIAFGVVALLNA